MNKGELIKIANLKDLKKYEESKEYKDILETCNIKQDAIKHEILDSYANGTVDRKEEYDFHDKQFAYLKFLKIMVEKIKDKRPGAEALRVEIETDIKYTEIGLGTRATNEFGIPFSASKLTAMDMKRVEAGNYRTFYTILNGLINTLDEPTPTNNEVY